MKEIVSFFGLFSQLMDSRVRFNTILSFSLQVSHHVIAVHLLLRSAWSGFAFLATLHLSVFYFE